MVRCSRLVIFYFKEKFRVSGTCWRDVCSEDLVEKIISPVLLDTNGSNGSFQMVQVC